MNNPFLFSFSFLILLSAFSLTSTQISPVYPGSETAKETTIAATDSGIVPEYIPLCPSTPCPCEGGLSEINFSYTGQSGVTVEFFSSGSLLPSDLIAAFDNVQTGDELIVNAPPGGSFNDYTFILVTDDKGEGDCKIRFWSNCPEYLYPGSIEDLQIIGKSFGDFTVTAYTDHSGTKCTLDETTLSWNVGGNIVGTSNALGTLNEQGVAFITDGQTRGILTSDGKWGFGTQSPTEPFSVHGNSRFDNRVAIAANEFPDDDYYKLAVGGGIVAEEVLVQLQSKWPDYVFEDDYLRLSLEELKAFIEAEQHLPGIPSAGQVKAAGGIEVGEMQRLTMEKIEELYLYLFEESGRISALQKENRELRAALRAQEARMDRLAKQIEGFNPDNAQKTQ